MGYLYLFTQCIRGFAITHYRVYKSAIDIDVDRALGPDLEYPLRPSIHTSMFILNYIVSRRDQTNDIHPKRYPLGEV